MSTLRLYVLLYVPLLVLMGYIVLEGKELEGHQLVPLNALLATGFFVAAILKILAVIVNTDELYQTAYIVATIVMGWWVFTTFIYAFYGLGPWGRTIVFAYVMAQNSVMLPYLLEVRRADTALKAAGRTAAESRDKHLNEPH